MQTATATQDPRISIERAAHKRYMALMDRGMDDGEACQQVIAYLERVRTTWEQPHILSRIDALIEGYVKAL